MDQKLLREREGKCVQENPPGCTTRCPVHVDIRGMIAAIRAGDYSAGFLLLQKMVPFPGIISRICDQPCQQDCKRRELDEAIQINALERFCVDNTSMPAAAISLLPSKNKKVAVIGAGLSGLTAALELKRKGYNVAVFEETNHLGGSVLSISESKLPRKVIDNDFRILENLSIEFHYNAKVSSDSTAVVSLENLCAEYDAVFIGVGCKANNASHFELDLDNAGNIAINSLTLGTSHPKVFAGGSLRRKIEGRSAILSICDGKIAAISIDRLLQNASLTASREKEGPYATALYTNIEGIDRQFAIKPLNGYTKDEALQEAGRCLLCECRECVKVCEYLAHYRSYPKRYVREVYNNLSIVMGIHHANKMINSCSLCGLCKEVCPGGLNMGEVCQEARQMMVRKGKMPPSAHDFALRDMQFSNSDKFLLNRHQPGFNSSSMVLYPGCQLAASSPHHVKNIYDFLCKKIDGGIGMMLGCCGAPAGWAGQEVLFTETLQKFESNWRELGSPKIITACPTCFFMFKHNFPEMVVESLWTLLDQVGLPNADLAISPSLRLAIHDSCTTRHEPDLQDSIRNIMTKLGHQIEELPGSREKTVCCGYGGLMIYANREIAQKVISKRVKESDSDYLTYCSMCRDNFISHGKHAYHLLDLIYSPKQNNLLGQRLGYSERQENRANLKSTLLQDLWDENVGETLSDIDIILSENVKQVLDDRMIVTDDVAKVIAYAESSGSKLINPENGHYVAYFRPVSVTYWVEYSAQGNSFIVHNAYCHRIEILK